MGDGTGTERALAALLKESVFLDAIQRSAERVNILDVFGIARHELAHSSFWAWLWDPNGSHRMGDRFLRAFLRHCAAPEAGGEKRDAPWPEPSLLEVEGADLPRATVRTESSPDWMAGTEKDPDPDPDGDRIARCRFDVRIDVPLGDGAEGGDAAHEGGKALVVVEFKIEARERELQTDDYRRAIEAVACGDNAEFTRALAVFVDYKSPRPGSTAFLPISLQELVWVVIGPIATSCRDLMPAGVAGLLEQYGLAVGEEGGNGGRDLDEFCGQHAEALAALREHLDWKPSLADLIRRGDIPRGAITFSEAGRTAEGRVALRGDQAEITVTRDGRTTGPFPSPSRAAQAAGREGRSYNGWAVWKAGGVPLADIRDRAFRAGGRADEYCRAILNGRRLAVKRLLAVAGAEAIAAKASPAGPSGTGRTLLADLVAQGFLTAGQALRFRGDEVRACTVEARGDGTVLVAGGREFTTPSGASAFLNGGKPSSGFVDLRYQDATGQWRPLEDLRDEYRRRFASKVADPDGN